MIPRRPRCELGAVAEQRCRGGGERQDVHLGVELGLGGVPHLAGLRAGEGARLGDEGVVLGVGDGGEVDPVGRLGAGHERHRQARDVEVEGGEEHVPCPGLEGDRVELGLVDTLQLHVDAELLPCRHGQFHRQRRVLDLDDVEGRIVSGAPSFSRTPSEPIAQPASSSSCPAASRSAPAVRNAPTVSPGQAFGRSSARPSWRAHRCQPSARSSAPAGRGHPSTPGARRHRPWAGPPSG